MPQCRAASRVPEPKREGCRGWAGQLRQPLGSLLQSQGQRSSQPPPPTPPAEPCLGPLQGGVSSLKGVSQIPTTCLLTQLSIHREVNPWRVSQFPGLRFGSLVLWLIPAFNKSCCKKAHVPGFGCWKQATPKSELLGDLSSFSKSVHLVSARCLKDKSAIQKIPPAGRTGRLYVKRCFERRPKSKLSVPE